MENDLFQHNGYLFVPGLIDAAPYYNIIKKLSEIGRGNNNDKQVPGAITYYKEPFFEQLLIYILPEIELYTGYELYKTYSYARYYHLGDELKPHTDRKACEITVSLTLGYEGRPWPLWIQDRKQNAHAFSLAAGDAVIFKGIELLHWREQNTYGDCGQVFLHYVDKNGPYADEVDDKLKRSGKQHQY
ncbi:hypothetical protein [Mucilaginibacter sp.]|uniref:hypothetical protein n=1 Tax=Mucilaginibacter sp. TaxID=1882438 RepID=UPI002847A68A|nr:hypothetical protein [Mucilaginibacter sp.]MDR3697530.1 hypothetical protein [Mucilaginibacter sp.]